MRIGPAAKERERLHTFPLHGRAKLREIGRPATSVSNNVSSICDVTISILSQAIKVLFPSVVVHLWPKRRNSLSEARFDFYVCKSFVAGISHTNVRSNTRNTKIVIIR